MSRRRKAYPAALRSPFVALLFFSLVPCRARGQVIVKVNDDVNFRVGVLFHTWADWMQDPIRTGYAQNFFLRRVRFLLVATLSPNVIGYYQTDDPRLGNAGLTGTKTLGTGSLTQDAFIEWRLAGDKAMIDVGLLYTPQSRGVLTSSPTNLSFDTPALGQQQSALTGSSAGRDMGLALKGYLIGERLEYRVGVFAGQRQTAQAPPGNAAGSRNSPRGAARIQYDSFRDQGHQTRWSPVAVLILLAEGGGSP